MYCISLVLCYYVLIQILARSYQSSTYTHTQVKFHNTITPHWHLHGGLRDRKKQTEVPETRSDVKEKRKKWSMSKARQVKNMTAEQKEKLKMKRRERYIRQKAAAGKTITVPEAPKDFAKLVAVLIDGATPSQNMELLNLGICIAPEQAAAEKVCKTISDTFQKLKNSRKRADRRAMADLVRATDTQDVAVYKLMGIR